MPEVPYGLCACGCGQRTKITPRSRPERGLAKGDPLRYVNHHAWRGRQHTEETLRKMSQVQQDTSLRGAASHRWKGGRALSSGYVVLNVGVEHPMADAYGRVREHRLVMAEAIGRYLRSEEVVHHRNGVRDDNRLENLELFETTAAHAAHHARERVKKKGDA